MPIAPRSLLTLKSLHVPAKNAHHNYLNPGVHLRWFSDPALGLPVRPVMLQRATLDLGQLQTILKLDRINFQHDTIMWVASSGSATAAKIGANPVPYPITLAPGEEISGYIPPNKQECIALYLEMGSALSVTSLEINTPDGFIKVGNMTNTPGWFVVPGLHRIVIKAKAGDQPHPEPPKGEEEMPIQDEQHTIQLAYWVSWWLVDILVRQKKVNFVTINKVGLPIVLANYYQGTLDSPASAKGRVRNGASWRRGLLDDFAATSAGATQIVSPDEENSRITSLLDSSSQNQPNLQNLLATLLNGSSPHASSPPAWRTEIIKVSEKTTATVDALPMFLLNLHDPGMARYFGFADLDPAPLPGETTPPRGELVMYRIVANYRRNWIRSERFSQAQRQDLQNNPLQQDEIELIAYTLVNTSSESATALAPSFRVRHKEWVSGLTRSVELGWDSIQNGQMQSIAIRKVVLHVVPTTYESLNPQNPAGWRLPILLPSSAPSVENKLIIDQASHEQQEYDIASMDEFGRWSDWIRLTLPAAQLSAPPTPLVKAEYVQPTALQLDDSTVKGTIRCHIKVPDSLPLGCPPIIMTIVQLLQLAENGDSHSLEQKVSTQKGEIIVEFTGPALTRGERLTLLIRSRFYSQIGWTGAVGEPSETSLTIADPRPPAPISLPITLTWATFPDALGNSTARLSWKSHPEHRGYRVYQATSITLDTTVESSYSQLAQAIANRETPPPRSKFELQSTALITPDQQGMCRFDLQLPGRSRMLYVYRIVALSQANVEEAWASPPALIFVAVPHSVRLSAPQLEAKVESAAGAIVLTITPGEKTPTRLRILRSANPHATLAQMMVVYEGPYQQETEQQHISKAGQKHLVVYKDLGPTNISEAPLRPWRQYTYRALIQVASESDAPTNLWSEPSAPVAITYIPPGEPAQSTEAVLHPAADDKRTITWECDLPIRSTPLGDFRFRLFLVEPGKYPRELVTCNALQPMQYTVQSSDISSHAVVLIETIDPLGRRSKPTQALERSIL